MTRSRLPFRAILGAALLFPRALLAFSGTEGASFLEIPVGGRPAALGSAYGPLANDSYASAWNPAGLGFLRRGEASLMHLSYLEAMSYESVHLAAPLKGGQGVGGGLQFFRAGETSATDAAGNPDGGFGGYYMSASVGYGRRFGSALSLGATGRLITASIAGVGASAFAGDLGAMGRIGPKLRVSLVAANLGSGLKFLQESDPLPAQLRAGAAVDVSRSFVVSLEGVRAFHSEDSVHAGLEWKPYEAIAVRAGYRSDVTRETGGMSGVTLGTGLFWKDFGLDYAWVPLGDLGQSQYFSLQVRFGPPGDEGPDKMGGGSIIVLP